MPGAPELCPQGQHLLSCQPLPIPKTIVSLGLLPLAPAEGFILALPATISPLIYQVLSLHVPPAQQAQVQDFTGTQSPGKDDSILES